MARVRAHRDGGRQRLCRAAGQQVHRRVRRRLRSGGFTGSLLLMGSHGGVISAERGCREPITLVESGPVGGCIGAAALRHMLGVDNLVAFDMGGTTAKCAHDRARPLRRRIDLLHRRARCRLPDPRQRHRHPRGRRRRRLDRLARRPAPPECRPAQRRLDAGAGLLRARRHRADRHRRQSAARPARPPIVSSAARWSSRPTRRARCSTSRIAEPLGYHGEDAVTRAAKGVLTIANLTMSSIIKKVSIARGYDPRDFALFCYGGGGPLHGIELARALKIPRVIVPPEPGNFSAVGMLLADPRLDTARTFVVPAQSGEPAKVARRLRRAWRHGRRRARREFGEGAITFEREAEMRYKGQHHSIKIAVADGDDAGRVARAVRPGISAPLRPRQRGGRGRDRGAAFARDPAHEAAGARPGSPTGNRAGAAPTPHAGRSSSWRRIGSCRPRSTIATRSGTDSAGTARRSSSNTDRAR